MASNVKTPRLEPVAKAVGKITAFSNRVATVHFYDIDENPEHIRGSELTFQVDIRPGRVYRVGDQIVAGWKRNPPRNDSNNAIRTEGTTSQGRVQFRHQNLAMEESDSMRAWLRRSAASLRKRSVDDPKRSHDQRAVSDATGFLQVQDSEQAPLARRAIPKHFGGAWLPVPVPVPEYNREWSFRDGYIRIGYVAFTVDSPAEEIQISEAMPFKQVNVLRSRTPIQKNNFHAQQQVTITLTFSDRDTVNQVLLPLLRLFRRVPFLPVFNRLLLEHNITALTLQSFQIQTMPGYPNALKAQLVCWNFNWEAYLVGARDLVGMDSLFCYPLLKLWVEKPCEDIPNHARLPGPWNGTFKIYKPDEEWLEDVSESPVESARAIKRNDDLANAKLAHKFSISRPGKEFDGFADYDTQTGVETVALPTAGKVPAKLFNERVGRAYVGNQHLIFYKTTSVDIAMMLARSPDLYKIIRSPVIIYRNTATGVGIFRELNEAEGEWREHAGGSFGWDTISSAELLDRLQVKQEGVPSGDPSVVRSLEADSYTFVMRVGTRVFDRISRLKAAPPVPDVQNPVPDKVEAFDPPSMVLEQISTVMENIIAPLQVRGERNATHQFMGSMATYFQIAGTLTDASDLGHISDFMTQVNELGRKYRGGTNGKPFGGFMIVENELFSLMGVRQVLPLSWNVSTIPEFPNALRFEMTLVEFDPTQRRREVIQDLLAGAQNDPVLATESVQDNEVLRYVRQNKINRRLRGVDIYPDLCLPTHADLVQWIEDIKTNKVWNWEDDVPYPAYAYLGADRGGTGWQWFARIKGPDDRIQEVPSFIGGRPRFVTPVPDEFMSLDPPENVNRYADPDFYCAPSMVWGKDHVERILDPTSKTDFSLFDTYGTAAVSTPGHRLRPEDIPKELDPAGTMQGGKKAADSVSVRPIGATPSNIDKILYDQTRQADGSSTSYATFTAAHTFQQLPPIGSGGSTLEKIRTGGLPVIEGATETGRRLHYQNKAAEIADYFGLDRALFFAMLEVESTWDQRRVSPRGAVGLGQLLPSTARGIDPTLNPHRPVDNMILAAKYLRQQLDTFKSEDLALAAYNAGPGNVRKYGGRVPPFKETQKHIVKVDKAKRNYLGKNIEKPPSDDPTSPAVAGSQPAERRLTKEAQQLILQFNAGNGYKLSETKEYMLEAFGSRSPYQKPFIKPAWVRSIYRDHTLGDRASEAAAHARASKRTLESGLQGAKRFLKSAGGLAVNIPRVIFGGATGIATELGKYPAAVGAGIGTAVGTRIVESRNEPETYYVIRKEFVQEFVDELSKRKLHFKLHAIPERLPGQYQYDNAGPTQYYHPPPVDKAFFDPKTGRDMFHDLRRSYIAGRLLCAFPTFYVAVVDGGRWLKVWRLFDHVYGSQAVTQIAINRTRKGPVETAVVGFSNMYGHMTAQLQEEKREQANDTRSIWALGALWRGITGIGRFDQETIATWAQHIDSFVLKPGARLHIRLGYGADASELPVVFNGVISEVPIDEGEIQVVALSDGVELTNDLSPTNLQGSIPTTVINGMLGEGINPRELVMSFMAPNSVARSISNVLGKAFGQLLYYNFRNEYGIEHFGNPLRGGLDFDDSEVGINIYNPESSTPYNSSTAFDSTARILQIWRWEKNRGLVGISMTQAKPWRVFDTVRKCTPDYILYPVPVDLRSTLFMGKGWFPLFTSYREDLNEVQLANFNLSREDLHEWKPFQQFHLASSDWNLIGNTVRADATNVYTKVQAVGTYNGWKPGDGDLSNENSYVMNLDTDIYDEFQRMKVVESGLYTTVHMKLAEAFSSKDGLVTFVVSSIATLVGSILGLAPVAVAGVMGLASGPIRSFFESRRVLDHFAAMTLKDCVKEMYQGDLIMLGNPYIKPYDIVGVADSINGMNGLVEVKEVRHTLSLETGYQTEASPDCIASFVDYEGQDLFMWLAVMLNHLTIGLAISKFNGLLARKASIYFTMRSVNRLRGWMRSRLRKAAGATQEELQELLGKTTFDEARDSLRRVDGQIEDLRRHALNGNSTEIRKVLDEISDGFEEVDLLKKAPFHIKAELQVQRALRSVPGLATAKNAKDAGASLSSTVSKLGEKIQTRATEELDKARAALDKAEAELKATGANTSKVDEVRLAIQRGSVDRADKALASAIEKVDDLKAGVKRAASSVRATKLAGSLSRSLRTIVRSGISKTAISTASAGIFTILVGSLSDYLIRWAVARQCLTLYPLRLYDKEFTAGINGHRGAVAGDRLGGTDTIIQSAMDWVDDNWWAGLIPVIGDFADAGVTYRAKELPPTLDVLNESISFGSETSTLGGDNNH